MQFTIKSHVEADVSQQIFTLDAYHHMRYSTEMHDDLFETNNETLTDIFSKTKRGLVIIDAEVYRYFYKTIMAYFDTHNIDITMYCVVINEGIKTLDTLMDICNAISKFDPLRRDEPIVAIGGGVLMDIAGMAACLYRRGTPFIRIPTTLLGMVDAGIGVKCGINYNGKKNKLGSYYPPEKNLICPIFLETLPTEHIINGFAEILKIALVKDEELFIFLEEHTDKIINKNLNLREVVDIKEIWKKIIMRSVKLMLEELSPNLYENNLQRAVDFGHTWSPFIELSDIPLLHGFAVNTDMTYSMFLAFQLNLIKMSVVKRVINLMNKLKLTTYHPLMTLENIVKQLEDTKKHRNGKQNIPLLDRIGHVIFVDNLDSKVLNAALELYTQNCGESQVSRREVYV